MVEQKRIINLRSRHDTASEQNTRLPRARGRRAQSLPTAEPALAPPARTDERRPAALIVWSAYEYERALRHPHWWLAPGAGALALILLGILIHSYFFVAFVALAFAVVVMYGHRPPREVHFSITREGVFVGRALHRFTDIKSFCIFDATVPYEISLEIDRITAPYLRLPLGELHPNKIRAILSDYIPEEQHKEFMSDHFARALGF